MHGQVRGKREGQDESDACSLGCLCHGSQNEEIGQGGRGARNTRGDGEGVEQEAACMLAMDRGRGKERGDCIPSCQSQTGPSQVLSGRSEAARDGGKSTVGQLRERIGTQQVDGGVQQVCGQRGGRGIRQEREERQQEGGLVEDAAVVGRDIVRVEEDALLHCSIGQPRGSLGRATRSCLHVQRLKLVTGVATSTRPESSAGSAGKREKSSRRRAAAAANSSSLCWGSTAMGPVCRLIAVVKAPRPLMAE